MVPAARGRQSSVRRCQSSERRSLGAGHPLVLARTDTRAVDSAGALPRAGNLSFGVQAPCRDHSADQAHLRQPGPANDLPQRHMDGRNPTHRRRKRGRQKALRRDRRTPQASSVNGNDCERRADRWLALHYLVAAALEALAIATLACHARPIDQRSAFDFAPARCARSRRHLFVGAPLRSTRGRWRPGSRVNRGLPASLTSEPTQLSGISRPLPLRTAAVVRSFRTTAERPEI
jgi:hypothetical protein